MKAIWNKIWAYITFKKRDPNDPKPNFNLRAMHTINKVSILMFLVGLVIMLLKWFVF